MIDQRQQARDAILARDGEWMLVAMDLEAKLRKTGVSPREAGRIFSEIREQKVEVSAIEDSWRRIRILKSEGDYLPIGYFRSDVV